MNLQQIKKLDYVRLKRNPLKHRDVLYYFRDIVKEMALGTNDPEWRSELDFLLERTNDKIKEVSNLINTKRKAGSL